MSSAYKETGSVPYYVCKSARFATSSSRRSIIETIFFSSFYPMIRLSSDEK